MNCMDPWPRFSIKFLLFRGRTVRLQFNTDNKSTNLMQSYTLDLLFWKRTASSKGCQLWAWPWAYVTLWPSEGKTHFSHILCFALIIIVLFLYSSFCHSSFHSLPPLLPTDSHTVALSWCALYHFAIVLDKGAICWWCTFQGCFTTRGACQRTFKIYSQGFVLKKMDANLLSSVHIYT